MTFANVIEGQIDEKQFDVPINFYAIQALNTGEGGSVVEQAADAWEKYVNQNEGQAGDVVIQSDDADTDEPGLADDDPAGETSSENEPGTPDGSEVDESADEAGLA